MVGCVTIEEDDRYVQFVDSCGQHHLARGNCHVDQRRNPLLPQGSYRAWLHFRIVERLRHKDNVTSVPRSLTCALDCHYRDRFRAGGELIDDKANLAVGRRQQRIRWIEMGEGGRCITERPRSLDHALARFGCELDARRLVQDERYSCL